ncbi:MAG: methyltransferase domain-containing protein [Nitrospirota bacterium]
MISRLRLALHLVILWLLVVTGGCAEWAYQRMNDPSRDAWQQPKTVIQALSIAPGSRVADLGAGGGYFTWRLAEAVGPEGKVYAVDVDETALRLIEQERAQRGVANVELVRATPTDARLPVAGVDLIFTCNTYHHLPDRTAYFQSLARALRPGGRIAVIEYKDSGWLFGHATPKETVLREMEAAGYRLIREFDFLPKQHFLVFGPIRS